jgi:hypothetical protein
LAIYHELLERDVASYDGRQEAPLTQAKRDMIAAGAPEIEQLMSDMRKCPPFCYSVAGWQEIVDALPKSARVGSIRRGLKNVFHGQPYEEPIRDGEGGKARVWLLGEKWGKSPDYTDVERAYREERPTGAAQREIDL